MQVYGVCWGLDGKGEGVGEGEGSGRGGGGFQTCAPDPVILPLPPMPLNTQDVAQQLMAEVAEMRELLQTQAKRLQLQKGQGQGENPSSGGGPNGPASDQLDEVQDELARVLEFVHGPEGDAMAKGSDVLAFGALQRLSYALLAAEQLTSYAGGGAAVCYS